jgi:cyclophilin family peptidyl-prolyl cis-trans isomerase
MKRKIYAAFCLLLMTVNTFPVFASSHREAPLLLADPAADNTDLYVFKSPDNPEKVTIIANYYPFQLPQGGPNFYSFGENIRYEIHIDNNAANNTYFNGDDIVYRFTFHKEDEDPTTFFNARLAKQNLKTTYLLERSIDGGVNFQTIVNNGIVPPPNIGPRSITSATGLSAPDYNTLITNSITDASTGEKVFCGTADDPFFVDLGGIFDLGDAPRTSDDKQSVDGLKCKNVSTIVMQVDVSTLQRDKKPVSESKDILDADYVIGVWASASRQKIRTLNTDGTSSFTGSWVQVSRLGMPLTNEAINPIGNKDLYNSITPYQEAGLLGSSKDVFTDSYYNPELGLYMDDALLGGAVPALAPLRIQKNSLGSFGFGNTQDGLFSLKGTAAVTGTALDDAIAGNLLLPGPGKPRSVDLWPIFHTGVPNLIPYQLATGKAGNPLAAGKPFVNNFLPNGGDMLRLNMAVPATPRDDEKFSSLGLIQAAALGLTDPAYNADASLQFIPNMDGFPNGRRLEDDVTRIELQAVGGIVLAAIGLPYDDYDGVNLASPALLGVLSYTTKVEKNDTSFKTAFPYVQTPWPGNCNCAGLQTDYTQPPILDIARIGSNVTSSQMFISTAPNPFANSTMLRYRVETTAQVNIEVYNTRGNLIKVLVNKRQEPGFYNVSLSLGNLSSGVYLVKSVKNGTIVQTLRVIKN